MTSATVSLETMQEAHCAVCGWDSDAYAATGAAKAAAHRHCLAEHNNGAGVLPLTGHTVFTVGCSDCPAWGEPCTCAEDAEQAVLVHIKEHRNRNQQ